MNTVTSLRATASPSPGGLASWYAAGLVDGFGDRLLMFDNTETEALELLRFHAALVATPGFEDVLHERVRQLGRLTHAAFPVVRAVERLDVDGSLALVSTHTPGKRLSAIFGERLPRIGLHPAFVTWVVSQVIQPLSILQSEGEGIAHSALTADRVILTPGGQVRVVEHVLGSALRQLDLSPARLWREFGLVVPNEPGGVLRFDARADVFQVGVLALSMLLARRVTPGDLEERLPRLLDQWSETAPARSRLYGDPLRLWLERALQIGDHPYGSAAEACADLRELPSASASRALEYLQAGFNNVQVDGSTLPMGGAPIMPKNSIAAPIVENSIAAPIVPENSVADPTDEFSMELPPPVRDSQLLGFMGAEPTESAQLPNVVTRTPAVAFTSRRSLSWIAVVLAAITLVEAFVIAMLLTRTPSEFVPSTAAAAFASPEVPDVQAREILLAPPIFAASLDAGAGVTESDRSGSAPSDAALDVGRRNADAAAVAISQAVSNQRSGGVRLSAPIELTVLQGDRVLGSSADGPIVTRAGTHQLDLINTALGFRARQAVTFRAGEITTLTIPVPRGRISVNAQPWAEVWIDNRPMGETPLANLDIPIGEHEVVFRHPELGERRQSVIVRADATARASTTFDR